MLPSFFFFMESCKAPFFVNVLSYCYSRSFIAHLFHPFSVLLFTLLLFFSNASFFSTLLLAFHYLPCARGVRFSWFCFSEMSSWSGCYTLLFLACFLPSFPFLVNTREERHESLVRCISRQLCLHLPATLMELYFKSKN